MASWLRVKVGLVLFLCSGVRRSMWGVVGNMLGSGVFKLEAGVVCFLIGVSLLKNFLFRKVSLPVPSILTRYWSKSLHSMMVPVLSHLLG